MIDTKRLQVFRDQMNAMLSFKKGKYKREVPEDEIIHYFHRVEKKFKKLKRKHESSLDEIFKEFTTHDAEEYSA